MAGQDTQGTITYMAPEMLVSGHFFDAQIDAWSLGILLCKMLTGRAPFQGRNDAQVAKKIVRKGIDFMENYWNAVSIEAQDVIENLLEKDPDQRMSILSLINHSWVCNENPNDKMR